MAREVRDEKEGMLRALVVVVVRVIRRVVKAVRVSIVNLIIEQGVWGCIGQMSRAIESLRSCCTSVAAAVEKPFLSG